MTLYEIYRTDNLALDEFRPLIEVAAGPSKVLGFWRAGFVRHQ
jgi:hypothetical protein